MSKVTPILRRKADHIRINLEEDVRSGQTNGLERYRFVHEAVPELDLRSIDTSLVFLSKPLRSPIVISSMVGGTAEAARMNLALAEAAQQAGIAMGLGSLRVAVEDPAQVSTFKVRSVAPDILLLGNLGAVQLNFGFSPDDCQKAVDLVQADALVLHFNPLQEALQPEGNVDFRGLLGKVEKVCRRLTVPVVAKEVGWGISAESARRLVQAGVTAIDVAGAGGTSWSQVEMHRAKGERQARLAGRFNTWGIPTAEALLQVRQALPTIPLIASGGIRSGTDLAKCIALGADLGGMTSPFLKAAGLAPRAVEEAAQDVIDELRICMFCTGSADLAGLRHAGLIHT